MVPNGFNHVIGLGNFPSDWITKSADELTTKITKGTTPPKIEIVKNSNTPFLRVNNLSFTGVLKASTEILFVSQKAHEGFLARSIAYPGDILMNIVGPPLGKISMLDNQYDEYNMNQAIVIYRTEPEQIDNFYFLKYLSSELAQQWLQSRSKKTSGQQNLTIQLCKELPVPVPPINEQRKIAKILSTWDKAISTTERLTDNSKQQKKALLQQLITGNKRLLDDSDKPFEGEWSEFIIGNVANLTAGATPNTKHPEYWGGNISWMSSGEVNLKQVFSVKGRITELGLKKSSTKVIPENSILIALAGQGKTRGTVAINRIKLCTNQSIAAIIPDEKKLNAEFLYFNLDSRYQELRAMSTGDGGRGGLNLSILKSIKLKLPSVKEQKKIADVLTNMDREIKLLDKQFADLKQEKKALMQQLLTGKRRVKINEKEVA